MRIKGIIASSSSKVVKEEDRRPPEEYDEPWDHKLKKQQKPDTSGTGVCTMGMSVYHFLQFLSVVVTGDRRENAYWF